MSLEELFKEGFLKKVPPSKERAVKSLSTSRKYLEEAKKTLKIDAYSSSILSAYNSIFHAARAVLFVDGVAERSHFAIYEYLKEKHRTLGTEEISFFNLYRKLRHSVAYGIDTVVGKKDAEKIVSFASEFLAKVEKYLGL